MLVGRERECGVVDSLLEEAKVSRSSALLMWGEAGIGKTALLSYARDHAQGMTVLAARGRESEAELAFAGLADLLRPVLARREAIPTPQSAALAGVLALGRPIPADRFTIGVATLSLLAAAAEERPLLATVDDVHWLDASSRDALLFAARRLHAEGVALLLAARAGEGAGFDTTDIPELRLTGLSREAARTLLASGTGRAVSDGVAERLLLATAGNPLALLEIGTSLSEEQLAGRAPLDDLLRLVPRLERTFQRCLVPFPDATRRALLVAAACDSEAMHTIAVATRYLGVDPAAFEPAEAAGIVAISDGRLEFRHPLVRSAVYHGSSPTERRAAHRALAEALADQPCTERRVYHLAAAAVEPDESVAAALEETAVDARARSGYWAAASALERAAHLTPGGEERARRLFAAADNAHIAGRPERAIALADEALASTADPLLRADIQCVRAQIETWHGSPMLAHELLLAEASQIEVAAPDRAALMLAEAAVQCWIAGRLEVGVETAQRAAAVAKRAGGITETIAVSTLGMGLIFLGDAPKGYSLAMRCESLLQTGDPLRVNQLVYFPGAAAVWVEDYAKARRILSRLVAAARAMSAPGLLPVVLAVLSELDFRTGQWVDAYARAAEAVRLASETGQTNGLCYSLVCLGRVEAAQGREADARAHVARASELAITLGSSVANIYTTAALGLLELGFGQCEQAIAYLEQTARHVADYGLREPGVVQWAPDLIEAYIRVGRRDEAVEGLATFEAQARHTERTWALAASARCHGLLAREDDFECYFEEALRWHGRTSTPFERARTELCLGKRLRRVRRRAQARERLRAALEVLERLGAGPWAEQARAELRASGEMAHRRDPSNWQALTPQEVQVALAIAQGATNRQAAAALFLSPKTIETHLGQIYNKLGIRSRTELAHLLASKSALPEAAPARRRTGQTVAYTRAKSGAKQGCCVSRWASA